MAEAKTKSKTAPKTQQAGTAASPKPDEVEEKQEAPKPRHGKQPTRLAQADHTRIVWSHVAEPGETFEEMLHPSTFGHVAKQLQVGHKIEVQACDGSWYGELYVRSVGRVEAFCAPISFVKFDGIEFSEKDDSPYAVAHRGPHMKWCVINRETKQVIKPNFDTEPEAGSWIAQHLKAIAA